MTGSALPAGNSLVQSIDSRAVTQLPSEGEQGQIRMRLAVEVRCGHPAAVQCKHGRARWVVRLGQQAGQVDAPGGQHYPLGVDPRLRWLAERTDTRFVYLI